MRFIIDAHLPAGIVSIFRSLGFEAIHTTDLAEGNDTKDAAILVLAADDGVVVSKDQDFYHSYLLYSRPPKLIFVKIGNLKLRDTVALFQTAAPKLIDLLKQYDVVELHRDKIIVIT